jgi:DNA-binding MarR family transcriptional regulator
VAQSEPVVRGAIMQELWVAARAGSELSAVMLRAGGVDPEEYGFLSFVGTLQPVTRTTLSRATGLRRTTVRDAVARLIERGHAEDRPNPEDGRSTLVVLTPAGQDVFDRGLPLFHEVLASLDAELEGTLREHEDAVRAVRLALQKLSARASRSSRSG